MRLARPGEELLAPGILQNPVPVLALYDREAAHEATLRNLLQRRGYESLAAVHAEGELKGELKGEIEGELKGRREALFEVLKARRLTVSKAERSQILAARDPGKLGQWIAKATTAASTAEALAAPKRPRHRTPRQG